MTEHCKSNDDIVILLILCLELAETARNAALALCLDMTGCGIAGDLHWDLYPCHYILKLR